MIFVRPAVVCAAIAVVILTWSTQMQGKTDRASDSSLHGLIADARAGDPAAASCEVHYQPIVRMEDVAIVAVEALARWHHTVAGKIETDIFVAGAEQLGLMGVLDDFVLNWACADANALAD